MGKPSGQRFCSTVPIAPGHRPAQRKKAPERGAPKQREVLAEEQRQARGPQHQRPDLSQRDLLGQQPRGKRHRPHRHRESEDRCAARRDHRESERDHHVPAGHVEESEEPKLRPQAPRNAQVVAGRARHGEQDQRPEEHAQAAKDPGREIGQRDFHRGPVESPRQGEPDEGPPKLRRHVLVVARDHRCGRITVAIAADTNASAA